ncbi:hypothetical protein [Streptomyces sp. NPDC051211]|uniref:hypothetical protein n=1 Tax=Streptomyces sp. NPDC051211 TaxID=3154643 RepID=UPI00344F78B8
MMNTTAKAAVKSLTVALIAGTAIFASAGVSAADNGPWGAPQAAQLDDNGPWGAKPAAADAGLLDDNGPW